MLGRDMRVRHDGEELALLMTREQGWFRQESRDLMNRKC